MNLFKSILTGVVSSSLVLTAFAADEVQIDGAKAGQWTMDFSAATKTAENKKLPMILNFTGSDWCGWCKLMDKNVFAQEEWKKFASENAMLITVDFPQDKSIVPDKYKERNKKLQEKFGVRGYPTYIVLDSDGETVLGQLGAGKDKTPASFIEEFKAVVRLSSANIETFIKENPDKADAFKEAIAESKKAKKELTDWLATKPERNEENTKTFTGFHERIQAAEAKLKDF